MASAVFGQTVLPDVTRQIEVRVGDANYGIIGLVERLAGRADH